MTAVLIALLLLIPNAVDDGGQAPRQVIVRTIVLDPGHGGQDRGAVGSSGLCEAELTYAIALGLRDLILADPELRRAGVRVVLTRDGDSDRSLEERAAIANREGGDLFISIHANSCRARSAHGAETYILSLTASDEHARRVAEIENQAVEQYESAIEESDDLRLILFDVIHNSYIEESLFLAERIQASFNRSLNLDDRGVKQAPFRVLKGVAMPAVLVEVDFISNPERERMLRSESYRRRIAQSLLRAIVAYKRQKERGYAVGGARETEGSRTQ